MSNGKGDKPRNCFSKEFRQNFDDIDWTPKRKPLGSTSVTTMSATGSWEIPIDPVFIFHTNLQ